MLQLEQQLALYDAQCAFVMELQGQLQQQVRCLSNQNRVELLM